jgi:hypothetical protein
MSGKSVYSSSLGVGCVVYGVGFVMYGFRLMVNDPFIGLWMLEVGCWGVAVGLVRATATIFYIMPRG